MNKFFESLMLRKEARRGAEIQADVARWAQQGVSADRLAGRSIDRYIDDVATNEYYSRLRDAHETRFKNSLARSEKKISAARQSLDAAKMGTNPVQRAMIPKLEKDLQAATSAHAANVDRLSLTGPTMDHMRFKTSPAWQPRLSQLQSDAAAKHNAWSTPLTRQNRAQLADATGDLGWIRPNQLKGSVPSTPAPFKPVSVVPNTPGAISAAAIRKDVAGARQAAQLPVRAPFRAPSGTPGVRAVPGTGLKVNKLKRALTKARKFKRLAFM